MTIGLRFVEDSILPVFITAATPVYVLGRGDQPLFGIGGSRHVKSLSTLSLDNDISPTETESFDLLFRGMEITTGGQRIHSYSEQLAKMERRGMNTALFESYLMMHRHGMPSHGGLGLGLERFTGRMLNLDNVRLAALFPRDINRLIYLENSCLELVVLAHSK